jgi:hypothetical protein
MNKTTIKYSMGEYEVRDDGAVLIIAKSGATNVIVHPHKDNFEWLLKRKQDIKALRRVLNEIKIKEKQIKEVTNDK